MSYNGSGAFTFTANTVQPAVAGTAIDASDFNDSMDEIEVALSTAICKDGQTTTTGRIPFDAGISVDGINIDGISSSFTCACTGPFASTNITVRYCRVADIVVLDFASCRPSGNSTAAPITLDMTNLPASCRPAVAKSLPCASVTDNGSDQGTPGMMNCTTSGDFTMNKSCGTTNFSSTSSTVGFYSFSISYRA